MRIQPLYASRLLPSSVLTSATDERDLLPRVDDRPDLLFGARGRRDTRKLKQFADQGPLAEQRLALHPGLRYLREREPRTGGARQLHDGPLWRERLHRLNLGWGRRQWPARRYACVCQGQVSTVSLVRRHTYRNESLRGGGPQVPRRALRRGQVQHHVGQPDVRRAVRGGRAAQGRPAPRGRAVRPGEQRVPRARARARVRARVHERRRGARERAREHRDVRDDCDHEVQEHGDGRPRGARDVEWE